MRINLVNDWRAVLGRAWSVKFNIAATLFGAAEVVVAIVQPAAIPNGVFAGIAAAISVLSNVARILAQKELSDVAPK
jgi:hypothetical protein